MNIYTEFFFQGLDERTIKAIEARGEMSKKMSEDGPEFDPDEIADKFNIIAEATCEDIIRQRQRLGGDWAVSTISKYKILLKLLLITNFILFFRLLLRYFLEHKEI